MSARDLLTTQLARILGVTPPPAIRKAEEHERMMISNQYRELTVADGKVSLFPCSARTRTPLPSACSSVPTTRAICSESGGSGCNPTMTTSLP